MKSKAILVSFVALFALVFALSMVSAMVDVVDVQVNDISVVSHTSVGKVSDTVPVQVKFTANADIDERVKVKVYVEGYKSEIYDSVVMSTPLEDGVTYLERFTLKLPSTFDLDDFSEDLTLLVRFSAKGEDSEEYDYALRMQKDLHSLNLLSVDVQNTVVSGEVLLVDVVVQNNGYDRQDNVYVKASIPELGLEKTVYLGDLEAEVDADDVEINDAVNKRLYLSVPRNVIPSTYELKVEAYNYDVSASTSKEVAVLGVRTGILPTVTSKTVAAGESATFDVVLMNPNNRMIVYSLVPEQASGLIVESENPIVTVPADSSRTVQVSVKATNSAEEGTHLVTVNVNSESGLERQVSFTLNVDNDSRVSTDAGNPVFVLTVVLAIIFVVLLIVLIVLLTKRPAEVEEFGETSYY